jgi:cyclic beta-1,2-glucan synthetase
MAFRHGAARYKITVENPHGVSRGVVHAELDGAALPAVAPGSPARIPLSDDGLTHRVRIVLG